MNDMKGTPWQPRDRDEAQDQQTIATASGTPSASHSGSHRASIRAPAGRKDGQNVDQDGLVVQAAAQLEDLLGDQAEDFPAGIPADNDDDDDDALSCVPTTPARSEAADPTPAAMPSGQPPPFRGAGCIVASKPSGRTDESERAWSRREASKR